MKSVMMMGTLASTSLKCLKRNLMLQAVSLGNIEVEKHPESQFAPNAGLSDAKLNVVFSCNCKFYNGGKCSSSFKHQELLSLMMRYLEMDSVALDLVVLGQIQSHLHCGEETVRTKKASQTARKRNRGFFL